MKTIYIEGHGDVELEAIGYSYSDDSGGVLHKRGSIEDVEKWAKEIRIKYAEQGLMEMGHEIYVLYLEKIPDEEVHKMLNICDYIGRFHKKHIIRDNAQTRANSVVKC